MQKIINAGILLVIALAIIYYLIPLLTGPLHAIALIVVVIGAIVGLLRIAGATF